MGFPLTVLRDLVGRSNHWRLVSKGQFVVRESDWITKGLRGLKSHLGVGPLFSKISLHLISCCGCFLFSRMVGTVKQK